MQLDYISKFFSSQTSTTLTARQLTPGTYNHGNLGNNGQPIDSANNIHSLQVLLYGEKRSYILPPEAEEHIDLGNSLDEVTLFGSGATTPSSTQRTI
jgi:hypothetical protein